MLWKWHFPNPGLAITQGKDISATGGSGAIQGHSGTVGELMIDSYLTSFPSSPSILEQTRLAAFASSESTLFAPAFHNGLCLLYPLLSLDPPWKIQHLVYAVDIASREVGNLPERCDAQVV